jgi:AcrR family transcriptional regulator
MTRAETRARTRSLLLDAAAEAFARKGFAGASVEDIAETAGFSTGALYSNFGSKDELFAELLSARSGGRLAGVAVIVAERSGGIGENWLALSRRLLEMAAEEVDLAALEAEFWLYAIRRPEFQARMVAQLRANREALATVLAERTDGPARNADVPFDHVATVVMALFQGLVQVRRIDPELVPEPLYGQAVQWLFAGLHAPPRPPLDVAS